MRFNDKVFLVTGGAMGIGAATVKRLAQEGGTVIIADRDEDAACQTQENAAHMPGQVHFQYVDLAQSASIQAMGKHIAEQFDVLHGLVNNAGIVRPASIEETGDADWEPQISINLRAPALCAQTLLPLLKAGPGHVVNISSEGGFRPRSHNWVYDATKAGICALTRNMATEFVGYGMRVNSVAPGWTVTEMHFGGSTNPAERKAELERLTYDGALIRRLARPEEIASAIVFLLSDDASFITATTLHVDGGRTAR